MLFPLAVHAQGCKVLDPELQGSYDGPCVNGLAEGVGTARGVAEYHGGFHLGKKQGHGVKTWANGDRYDGDFVDGRKEGHGVYTWGTGPWKGERYDGGYVDDKRQGYGVYTWPSGDVYRGPWKADAMTGPATPMMLAHAKYLEEAKKAVAKVGQKVCRPSGGEWIRGTVTAVSHGTVGVRLEGDEGAARKGEVVWTAPERWTPCH